MNRKKIITSLTFILILLIFSCEKKEKQYFVTSQEFLIDKSLKQRYSNDISKIYNKNNKNTDHSIKKIFGSNVIGNYISHNNTKLAYKDIFVSSKCFIYKNELFIVLLNENLTNPSEILINITEKKPNLHVIFYSDNSFIRTIKPQKFKLLLSDEKYNIGDTIVGEIFLNFKDSISIYNCKGNFIGVVDKGTKENVKYLIFYPSGNKIN